MAMLPSRLIQIRALMGFFTVAVILGTLLWLFEANGKDTLFYVVRAGLMASTALLGWELYKSIASRTALAVCITFSASLFLQVIENVAVSGALREIGGVQLFSEDRLLITVTFPTALLLLLSLAVVSRVKPGWPLFLYAVAAFIIGTGLWVLVNWVHTICPLNWSAAGPRVPLLILLALMLLPLVVYLRLYFGRGTSFLLGISVYLLLVLLNGPRWSVTGGRQELTRLLDLLAHVAIPFGFALDGLDAIGRTRATDDNQMDLSQRDPLTGIYNRRALDAIGSTAFDDSLKTRQPVSILMFDIDHFKKVNDVHGHAAGDAVLRQFAGVLARHVRGTDVVARYGGEEFIAVLPSAPLAPAIRLAERIRSTVENLDFLFEGKKLNLTVSIGAATAFPDEPRLFAEVIDNADRNLYRAKRSGRNKVLADPIEQPMPRLED